MDSIFAAAAVENRPNVTPSNCSAKSPVMP
jgi:hypothetical protein